jgi:AmmeMemoRadiSam system protein B
MDCKKIILLSSLFLVGSFLVVAQKDSLVRTEPKNISAPKSRDKPTHPLKFFDKDSFYSGLEHTKNTKPFPYRVRGGVVPHHLFASFIIADFFSRISAQTPNTIILLGPNHPERGNFKALVSHFNWQTPFGLVEPNTTLINDLIKKNLVKIDEEALSEDQAVAGLMPFVKYYLPSAQVVPVLLSGYMSSKDAKILADNLRGYMDKDTVVIAAVDFSHNLNSQQAQEKDKVTLELMKNFDYERLFSLNNDYLDGPPSVAVLLMTMQSLGTLRLEVLYHTNSGELQKDESIETTSYFSLAYH